MKSIKTQMVLSLIVVTTLVFGWLNIFVEKKIQEVPEYFLSNYQEIASARADEISKELYGMVEQVGMVSRTEAILSMDLERVKDYLSTQVIVGKFRNMTFSDASGNAWTTYNREIDISDQKQYQAIIIDKKDWYISDPFISPYTEENVPIITVSHAIKKDGEIIGLVNAVVPVQFMDDVVSGIKFKDDGFGWIISSDGNIISHPNVDDDITDVTCLIQEETSRYTLLTQSQGNFNYTSCRQVESVGVFSRIRHTNDWKLILSLDRVSAFGEVYRILSQIQVAFLVILGLLITLAFVFSNYITEPILELKDVFDEAASGNFEVSANEKTRNEVGLAAKSFNQMLGQLKKLTYHDPIINLYNYQSFLLELKRYVINNSENHRLNYIVIVSIDDFKKINSVGGYEFGNHVLHDFSQKIFQQIEKYELIARYFGDELILLLSGNNERSFKQRLNKLMSSLSVPLVVDHHSLRLDISMGAAQLPSYDDFQSVIHQATLAKLQAKKMGGHTCVFYDETVHQGLLFEQTMEESLFSGLANGEFYLVYQPIVDMMTQKTLGVEALLRWDHPIFKDVPIYKVIELAERRNYIYELGKFALEEALKQLKVWQKLYPSFFVSVNVSALQLSDERFIPLLTSLVDESGISPQTLVIEITESAAMSEVETTMKQLSIIKSKGIQIAIDDFGTGYSSLAYLTNYPLNHIKIDRSFISAIELDRNSKLLVLTMINMAKSLNFVVVAEGVETQTHFSILRALGCHRGQGYYMSRPVRSELIDDRMKHEGSKYGDFFTK